MAGGMNKRGAGIPLRDRVRAGAQSVSGTAPGAAVALGPRCPARHCWVADALDGDGEKRPGLLLEWRQGPDGWDGLVVYAARVRDQAWGLVQEWLPGHLLTPL